MLWIGLGNPGASYAQNRHNIGFMIVDHIADYYRFSGWQKHGKSSSSSSMISSGVIDETKIRLIKPLCFMNLSGEPVASIARYFDIPTSQIIVFHDDIDLAKGQIRVKCGGGHGGHNGLRDLDRHIGTRYWRVRIGVGRPEQPINVDRWVLSDFTDSDRADWLDNLISAIILQASYLVHFDIEKFMANLKKEVKIDGI